ncbi:hypothetical protein LWI29_031922 [Acer saccharum]|uniref:Cytochrome P450 n=1 Tax=Acer saccharum TaxID=4024 RepID=A0AA39SDB3_ACESA|nr:hypothetical protein LWI29_031922 [Acer saccharum]
MIQAVINNIVSRCVLGRRTEEENGRSKFGELARRLMVQFTAFCFGDMFPCLGWIDVLTGHIGRLNATFRALDAFFDQVIEEHMISSESDNDDRDGKDFVHILLRLQKDGMLEIELSKDNISHGRSLSFSNIIYLSLTHT